MFNPNFKDDSASPESDDYLARYVPLEVKVTGKFEDAMHKFRAMVTKERIMSSLKEHESYEKPSVKRRRKSREAKQRMRKLQMNMEKFKMEKDKEKSHSDRARRKNNKNNNEEVSDGSQR